MPNYPLQIRIGDCMLTCDTVEDAATLAPVTGIVAGEAGKQYSLEQLEKMVATLQRYDRRTGRLRTPTM
jgi:hypothetical protein